MTDFDNTIPEGFCQCGCGQKTTKPHNKFLKGHNMRGKSGPLHPCYGDGRFIGTHGYIMATDHNHPRANRRGYVREHILIAEQTLGKYIELPHVIHHHSVSQLVICQDQAYHVLLHQRTRALKESGHANWLWCRYCKTWDDPQNMFVCKNSNIGYHRKCHAEYERLRQKMKREEITSTFSKATSSP